MNLGTALSSTFMNLGTVLPSTSGGKMKRIVALLLAAVMIVGLAACGSPKAKEFSIEEMKLTLTADFKEGEYSGYTKVFESKDAAAFVLREDKSLLGGETISIDEYVELCRQANAARNPGEAKKEGSVPYFEYTFKNPETGVTYSYFTAMYESEKAFWLVQFACGEGDYAKKKADFIGYASSVKF